MHYALYEQTCDAMFVFGRSLFSSFLFSLVTYIMIKRYDGAISSIWSHHNVRFAFLCYDYAFAHAYDICNHIVAGLLSMCKCIV